MKKFVVSENKHTNLRREVTVEAKDAEEARRIFNDMTVSWNEQSAGTDVRVYETMGSSLLDQVPAIGSNSGL